MKKILVLTTLLMSFTTFSKSDYKVSINKSPKLTQLMENINIYVEAAGAFYFHERKLIVEAKKKYKKMRKQEVIELVFNLADLSIFYTDEEINDLKKRFSKMIGAPKHDGYFNVITSKSSITYYDIEYIAISGKEYFFTLEDAYEN